MNQISIQRKGQKDMNMNGQKGSNTTESQYLVHFPPF